MEYKTIYADTPPELDELVNKALANGWELYGYQNVSVYTHETVYGENVSAFFCTQAVIRKKV